MAACKNSCAKLLVIFLMTCIMSLSDAYQLRVLGDSCETVEDCIQGGIQGSVGCGVAGSTTSICACKKGFIGNEAGNHCLPFPQEIACQTNAQCTSKESLGRLARCYNGKCQCFDTNEPDYPKHTTLDRNTKKCTYASKTYLVAPPLIGESCTSDAQCQEGIKGPVKCKDLDANRVCQCDRGYSANQGKNECVALPLIGESCTSTSQCQEGIKGPVKCKDTDANPICQCDRGYSANQEKNECVANGGEDGASFITVSSTAIFISIVITLKVLIFN